MKRPIPRSVISMDIGRKRVGLAGCDPLGISITPLPALIRANFNEDLNIIKMHCKERNVEGIIIGLPLDQNGKETQQSRYCEDYGVRLSSALHMPIAFVNEHSSTWAVIENHKIKKDRKGKIDSRVAALLLEQWLTEGPELKPAS